MIQILKDGAVDSKMLSFVAPETGEIFRVTSEQIEQLETLEKKNPGFGYSLWVQWLEPEVKS